MICKVCNTNNPDPHGEFCTQCGSDLKIYKILNQALHAESKGKLKSADSLDAKPQKENSRENNSSNKVFFSLQITLVVFFLFFAIIGIIAGIKLIYFLDNKASVRDKLNDKWAETGLQQLQQMQSIVRDELDIIIEDRLDNKLLQNKIQELQHGAKTESGVIRR